MQWSFSLKCPHVNIKRISMNRLLLKGHKDRKRMLTQIWAQNKMAVANVWDRRFKGSTSFYVGSRLRFRSDFEDKRVDAFTASESKCDLISAKPLFHIVRVHQQFNHDLRVLCLMSTHTMQLCLDHKWWWQIKGVTVDGRVSPWISISININSPLFIFSLGLTSCWNIYSFYSTP